MKKTAKSPQDQAQELLLDGLDLDTPVVRGKRLQGRNDKPGFMKAELPSPEHMVKALWRKTEPINMIKKPMSDTNKFIFTLLKQRKNYFRCHS